MPKRKIKQRIAIRAFRSEQKRIFFCKKFLLIFLFIFCLIFGGTMFIFGEKLKKTQLAENVILSPFEKNISQLVSGHPIEIMLPQIAKQDKEVVAYLLAIAKKESNWGKYHPQKNGRNCFNYWGYRGEFNQTDSGYSCFMNPSQAVSVVGGRIQELLSQEINTPQEMVIWKCGRACSQDDPMAVQKWIDDVAFYHKKVEKFF